jgi:hypothetical protein
MATGYEWSKDLLPVMVYEWPGITKVLSPTKVPDPVNDGAVNLPRLLRGGDKPRHLGNKSDGKTHAGEDG